MKAFFKFQLGLHLLQSHWLKQIIWPSPVTIWGNRSYLLTGRAARHITKGYGKRERNNLCPLFNLLHEESAMLPCSHKAGEIEVLTNRTNEYHIYRISGRRGRSCPDTMKYTNRVNFGIQLDFEEQRLFHGKYHRVCCNNPKTRCSCELSEHNDRSLADSPLYFQHLALFQALS